MQNMSDLAIRLIATFFLALTTSVQATKCDLSVDDSAPKSSNLEQTSNICVIDTNGALREVQLSYYFNHVKLLLKNNGKKLLLEDIGKEFDPTQVGAASHIRFLPARLQAYRSQGYLLFTSSRRSASGAGGGQCGSGVEDYLNVLDINIAPARVKARFLIGSCIDGIELVALDKFEDFNSFWVADGRLHMQFLSYDARCEDRLGAFLDSDFRKLRFVTSRSTFLQK